MHTCHSRMYMNVVAFINEERKNNHWRIQEKNFLPFRFILLNLDDLKETSSIKTKSGD